jgi:zona occludens toxin
MIYLRTGSNGSCKTLFTLADVRKLQLETGRPVCINQRFKMNEAKRLEFGWNVIDFKDWQAEPDGTIFLIDECHNDLPVRPSSQAVPDPIRMLAEHRSRGFDFYLLTQHPMNIDGFVRKLIGAPGWHQHLKRAMGGTNVTRVLQWDAVNTNCEKDGSGKSAQISTRTQPKEVYEWYDSASLHTAKVRIPKQVYILALCALLVPALFWFGLQKLKGNATPQAVASTPFAPVKPATQAARTDGKSEMTPVEYLSAYTPRIPGLPHTAPRYDEVTKPTTAPFPAACVQMGNRCDCFTQQGTKLPTDAGLCGQIVRNGFFQDWGTNPPTQVQNAPDTERGKPWEGNPGSSSAVQVGIVTKGDQIAQAQGHDGEVLQSMRIGKRLVQ